MSFDGKGRKTIREIQAITEEKLAIFQTRGTLSKTRGLLKISSQCFLGTSVLCRYNRLRVAAPCPHLGVGWSTGRVKERSRARSLRAHSRFSFFMFVHPSPGERNRLIERPIGVKALLFVADETAGEGEFQKSSPLLG